MDEENFIFVCVLDYLIFAFDYLRVLSESFILACGLFVVCTWFLFLGEHNYSWPLWYLLASLIAACLIYLFVKIRLKTRGWFLIGLLLMF